MGDSRRFDIFAKFIARNFNKHMRVADIAGGKGYLNLALRQAGFENVITFDIRNVRVRKVDYKRRLFNNSIKEEFDLLVGLHPDEATDHIIMEAAKRKIPFVIVPCCVKPDAATYWGSKSSERDWLKHLTKLAEKQGFEVIELTLKINGKNKVLMGKIK